MPVAFPLIWTVARLQRKGGAVSWVDCGVGPVLRGEGASVDFFVVIAPKDA